MQLNGKRVPQKSRVRSWLKTIFVWSFISLLWQIPFYYFFNQQVNQVLNPNLANSQGQTNVFNTSKTSNKKTDFTLAASNISNPSVSYDDRYLAYYS